MYITKSNFKRIIRQIEIPEEFTFDDVVLWVNPKGVEYKADKYAVFTKIFSKNEKKRLLAFKAICKGDKRLIKYVYNKIESPIDSYKYVQVEKSPSYHSDANCKAMKSDFQRVIIPEQIQNQGASKVWEFRKYWNDNEVLRERDINAFIAKVNLAFSLDPPIRGFNSEVISNSGVQTIDDNRSVNEINLAISDVWNEFTDWIKEDRLFRMLCCNELGYLSWISVRGNKVDDVLPEENANKIIKRVLRGVKSEQELYDVLQHIYEVKKQLMDMLQELYIRSYIPDLDFDDSLLESLGFEPCSVCTPNEQNAFELL